LVFESGEVDEYEFLIFSFGIKLLLLGGGGIFCMGGVEPAWW
jgi:hypothetical protein